MIAKRIRRVFIANRGEIAVRVVRACRALGIECVVGVSSADRDTLAARLADRAICIGPPMARDSYLQVPTIITAAKGTGCDALHPGYGFLSERPALAEACVANDLTFIGPSAAAMRAAGDKIEARKRAEQIGVPLAAGSREIETVDEARQIAERVGYPVLLKASAGGGGRGMRVARDAHEIGERFEQASSEALEAFGDGRLFLERFVKRARHIEVQVLGDSHGNVVHLHERDCSVQRRHQKIIEEAPAPDLPEATRQGLLDAALRFARSIGYSSAGTVEFLYDTAGDRYYFLEMNTRIQVEHPVTEAITGIDLVVEQIRIAEGAPLSFAQADVKVRGHAIECRINVEDADRDFMPSPGRITRWELPVGDGIRIDSHGYAGYRVPPYYDSLLAKLICAGADRGAAITQTLAALDRIAIEGVHTNLSFHRFVLSHADFAAMRVSTRWIENTGMSQYLEHRRSQA
ncbi:acetyl/propionyl/methylcrotonyl-CoA carboxylase subunit alpha [uncultured Nevskia sp.]|uniref:acetyl-CoA carboxylase biotin carboxylase subunit n=1 Tax=uncultured Nevskia sp. TaxID=228950 RepID=UPI0025DA77C4|nr:acetyl-CoA carboxylase biotin carboxylase subunit [uncultured Nevskia sp.]